MSSTAIPTSRTAIRTAPVATRLPWYVAAAVVAATSAKVGVIWDISWHRSIGRDTFWTPAHMAIYLGGVLAGLACGWLVLRTTFTPAPEQRDTSVAFWGFRGPLGAWVCIWGAFAMITSAPFDNWWHNAYGLDVKVLSPPHVILALGIWALQLGALFLVLALQNRNAPGEGPRSYSLFAAYMIAILLQNVSTIGIEQIGFANLAHNALYYQVAAGGVPLLLVAAGRGIRLRWPATTAAACYMAFSLAMIWILQLAPATPKLAPVFTPVTHLIPRRFRCCSSCRRWRSTSRCAVSAEIATGGCRCSSASHSSRHFSSPSGSSPSFCWAPMPATISSAWINGTTRAGSGPGATASGAPTRIR